MRRAIWAALAVACSLALSGCGLQASSAYVPQPGPGSLQKVPGAEGTSITVTGKNFTEQLIMSKIAALTARASGFRVKDLSDVPGSVPVRQLMLTGGADITFDYTGTAWLTYLGHQKGIPDPQKQWQAVHDADLKNGLTWGKPSRENNTYALAIRQSSKAKLGGITKLSQLKDLPVKERTFCVEDEFYSRQDGFKPMLKKYGLTFGAKGKDGVPRGNVAIMDTGAVYSATAHGACNFGEVFTTDGRIKALHLLVLQDDKHFFPSYASAPVFGTAVAKKYPQLVKNFAAVTAKWNNALFQRLNAKVDLDGEDPASVAFDWMRSEGFITG
ncbi:MAG TPA: glycine betaine ABC transporter substrate-binding protein [Microbacteriaceae bacterium]|nr:glycine betaine ABC transporter substrate-binding protein [Microbacteriaceae bacterium]